MWRRRGPGQPRELGEEEGRVEAGHRLDSVRYADVAQQRENIGGADRKSCPGVSSLQAWEIRQCEEEAAGIIGRNHHHL